MDKNSFLIDLAESDRTMFGRMEFADQPEEQQVFAAIWELEDGYSANFAPQALRTIKAHRVC